MRSKPLPGVAAGALFLSMALAGCGDGGAAPSAKEAKPFSEAIQRYMKERHMDMEPAAFESLSVEGATATAAVRMRDKAGLYALQPEWKFTFRRKDAGAAERWEVASVEK